MWCNSRPHTKLQVPDPATWLVAGATTAVRQRWAMDSPSKAIYVSEQVYIGRRTTGAYYSAKLTFSHYFPIKVWGAYNTSMCIIFKFLW